LFFWRKRGDSSSSGGWRSKARELLPLLAGIVLTAAAVFLARQRIAAVERTIRDSAAPVDVVVASVTIPAGSAFSEENLAKKAVPGSGTSRRNVPPEEFELLLGARSKTDIAAGEPILWTDVEEPFEVERFSRTIPLGRRAVTLDVDAASSFAGLIRPGDRVDLLCEGEAEGAPRAWIRNIPVVAVDRSYYGSPPSEEDSGTATVTLTVSPAEGSRLAAAARHGRIRWFLRNPEDGISLSGAAAARSSAPEIVEIWLAGIRVVPPDASRPLLQVPAGGGE
jgi:pilus assembly protein CpaB